MAGYRRRGRVHRSRSQSRSRHPLRRTRRTGHSRTHRRSVRPRATVHGPPVIKRRPLKRRIRHEEEEPEDELEELGEITEPVDNFEL